MHDAVSCVPTAQHQRALRQISMMQRQLVRCYQPRLPRPIVSPDDCTAPRCILCVKKSSCAELLFLYRLRHHSVVQAWSQRFLYKQGVCFQVMHSFEMELIFAEVHTFFTKLFFLAIMVTLQPHGLSSKIVNFILSDDAALVLVSDVIEHNCKSLSSHVSESRCVSSSPTIADVGCAS